MFEVTLNKRNRVISDWYCVTGDLLCLMLALLPAGMHLPQLTPVRVPVGLSEGASLSLG